MAIAFITGMQGTDPRYFKTIATSKHYAVHSGPETTRHQFDAKVSGEELDNTYLYAFRKTVEDGHVDSLMCAYNAVNGAPACASTFLLQQKLRDVWHFSGYVVSDCDAIDDIYTGHHSAASLAKASAKAVKAGTDLDCGKSYSTLVDAVKKGHISEDEITRSVQRLFVAWIRLGMFDPPEDVPFSKIGMDQVQSPEHQRLALEAARKSIVLLKNEAQTLPLQTIPKRIAVVGPAADEPDALLANYNGIPSHIVTPLLGIQQKFGKRAQVRYALGSTYVQSGMALVPENVLTPPQASGEQHGLKAEYFANGTFSGEPVLSRVEPQGYFIWDIQDPAVVRAVPRQKFSLRWTGNIQVNQSSDYQFGVIRAECHSCGRTDTARVYIDDKLIVNDTRRPNESMSPQQSTVHLEAGQPKSIRVEYSGTGGGGGLELVWKPPAEAALRDAVDAVQNSDLAIVCIGLNARLEGEESKIEIPGFSGGYRTNIDLPESQQKLFGAVAATGKPIIVVLINGSALAVQQQQQARAILAAWYPGQEGGAAIAETLSGENDPAGRLPVTFYQSASQLPAFDDYSMKGRSYRFFKGKLSVRIRVELLEFSLLGYQRSGRRIRL
jgi:beta-glucosidase